MRLTPRLTQKSMEQPLAFPLHGPGQTRFRYPSKQPINLLPGPGPNLGTFRAFQWPLPSAVIL